MKYYQVPQDSLNGAFGKPRKIIVSPFYKGSIFATIDLKGGKRKRLKISTYGGFYTDLDSNKIYFIREKNRSKFDNILRNARHKET